MEDIDHTRTKAPSPQTNGICERFHKTVLDEFYRIEYRKKIYHTLEDLQADRDFETLRGTKEFKALVDEAERRLPKD